tara:strand:+ start:640 stop:1845 length:1206 start_codon:yes stop_codon:yes gene_type:complete
MSDIKTLLKNKNYEDIYKILDSDEIYKLKIDFIKHILYRLEDDNKAVKYFEKLFDKYQSDEAFLTLGMRIYLNLNDVDGAYKLLKLIKHPKKRNIIPIFKFYCKIKDELAFKFYNKFLYNNYILENNEYICLINNYYDQKDKIEFIFNDMKYNILSINPVLTELLLKSNSKSTITDVNKEGICLHCKNKLNLIDLNKQEKLVLIKNIEDVYKSKNFDHYKKFINKKDIDIFIDAGNLIFYQEREFTKNSFLKINLIIEKLKDYKTLVIIHKRHFDNLRKSKINKDDLEKIKQMYKSWNKYETPYHENDDWYFIYGSLMKEKSFIVSNDKLRDHQFKVSEKTNVGNTLQKFIDRHIIRYDFTNRKYNLENVKLQFPNTYSTEIQKSTFWHFPTDKRWLCYEI